jgi:eukaryotic-like serine/threonine-protein kinase
VLADLPQSHPARVEAVAIDPEGELVASADSNGLVKVWRVSADSGLVHQADLAGHTGAVYSLSFTPGGRTLASGGVDRTVVLWDPLTGQERLTLTGHADQLIRVQFTADGGALWSVSRDGAVKRWRTETPGVPHGTAGGGVRIPFNPGFRKK